MAPWAPLVGPERQENETLLRTGYDRLEPTWGQSLGAAAADAFWDYSGFGSAYRTGQMDNAIGQGPFGIGREYLQPLLGRKPVDEQRWKDSASYRPGLSYFEGMTEEAAALLAERHDERARRADILARDPGGYVRTPLLYATGFATGMADPVGIAASFIPVVGEVRYARMLAQLGKPLARAARGVIEGAVGQAAIEPLVYAAAQKDQLDYSMADSLANIAMGAGQGALLHVGGGWIADLFRRNGGRVTAAAGDVAIRQAAAGQEVDVRPAVKAAIDEEVARVEARPAETVSLPTTVPEERIDIPGTTAREVETPEGPVIRAYHGSPHRFDAFSMEHIGAGEGAQAFGHGLYFAEREGVARSYLEALGAGRGIGADDSAARILESVGGDQAKALEVLDAREADVRKRLVERPETVPGGALERIAEQRKSLESGDPRGALYTVDIHADPERMLDWDKPLSEQSEHVRAALESHADPMIAGTAAKWGGDVKSMLSRIAQRLDGGMAEVSQRLREAGIEGIRYLDGGSRDAGEGTRNFVIFDDSRIRIREINGKTVEMLAPEPAREAWQPLTDEDRAAAEATTPDGRDLDEIDNDSLADELWREEMERDAAARAQPPDDPQATPTPRPEGEPKPLTPEQEVELDAERRRSGIAAAAACMAKAL